MELILPRYTSRTDSVGGLLCVDNQHHSYTCEDQHQEVKVPGETCIDAGRYRIKLRDVGTMTRRYAEAYPFHRGMLHLQNVPEFLYVYIHTGNDDDDTEGCILVGFGTEVRSGQIRVMRSREAYADLYKKIIRAMDNGEEIWITIKDL